MKSQNNSSMTSSSSSSFLRLFPAKDNLSSSRNRKSFSFSSQNKIKGKEVYSSLSSGFQLNGTLRQQSFSGGGSSSLTAELPSMNRKDTPLKIAIVGFGNFGQFLAEGLKRQGHVVMATSRTDYTEVCKQQGIQFFRSIDNLCTEKPDILLVCTSIMSTENVVRSIPFNKLKPDTIFVDVLSVKQFPRNLFLEVLPPEFGIVCTHPMFGPESGKDGWVGLPFVYDQVRVTTSQAAICARFLNIFQHEGCRMVEMSCEEHDRHAAGSQFITHTIGRILSHLNLESTPINTKGYETLLKLTENTVSDSFDLYYGLFMYNVNATEQIENLDRAFETVKQKLFGRLHDILRKQIVERVPISMEVNGEWRRSRNSNTSPYFLPRAQDIDYLASFASTEEVASSKARAPGIR